MSIIQDEPNREVHQVADRALVCPRCGKENGPGQRFCSQCGSRLWEPCCQCGHLEPASERYCGHCGANLQGALRRMQERIEADLEQIKQLERDGQIDEAIAALERIPKIEHSQLLSLAALAERTLDRLRRGITVQTLEAKEKIEQALALAQTTEYEQIVALLEPIPPGLRNEEAETLLLQTRQKLERIRHLEASLNGQLDSQPVRQLISQCDELLRLRPGHQRALEVLQRISVRLHQKANKLLAAHRYQEVVRLVDQLPADRQEEKLRRLRRQAAEADWLWQDLAKSPVVDPVVEEAIQRLERLSPGHPQLANLKAALEKRQARARENPLLAHATWASRPKQWPLGCPVEWTWQFRRIQAAESLRSEVYGQLTGLLWTACGLALQGLGLAEVEMDLTPKPESTNLASRITGLLTMDVFSRKEPAKAAWGVDIGNWALKAVRLRRTEQDQVEMDRVVLIPYGTYLSQADDQDQIDAVVQAVESFLSGEEVKETPICLSPPMQYTFVLNLALPYLPKEKQTKVLQFELGRRISLPLQEIAWDYYSPLRARETAAKREGAAEPNRPDGQPSVRIGMKENLLLVGVKRGPIARICHLFREAKLPLQAVQYSAVGLYNALAYEKKWEEGPWADPPPQTPPPPPVAQALLDVGAAQTVLVVHYRQNLWVRPMRFGVSQLFRSVVQQCGVSYTQADALLQQPQQAEWLHELYGAIQPVFETLAEDVRSTLQQAANHLQCPPVQKLLCCGGGIRVHGLLREFYFGQTSTAMAADSKVG